jgi:dihydrofolate reductase
MGRKTFESFPQPLPNRKHIVITRDKQYDPGFPEISIVHSVEAALDLVSEEPLSYVIGGGEIYTQSLEHADTLEITRVYGRFEGDAYFPAIDDTIWEMVHTEYHPADEKHRYAFTYITYIRRPVS